jgi:hypothetical protein
MHRSNQPAPDLFSHPSEPVDLGAPHPEAVRLPVFSDAVTATPSVATDEDAGRSR